MITIPGRIPITIHPLFWVMAVLIGFFNGGQSVLGTLVWVGVILFSVLVHEFGHATTALFFGLKPRIELVALGGLTYHQGDKLSFKKQFFIVLNGPLFGFMLFVVSWALLKLPALSGGLVGSILLLFMYVNLIWTVLNLVPVMPLDGGQLLRIVLESIFGAKGFKYSLVVGMTVATGISLVFFFLQNFLIGALFFLFAFQSYDLFRRLRSFSEEDRSDVWKQALQAAELDLQSGRKDRAEAALEHICKETHEGMIHLVATQYLALIKNELGDSKTAYDLLKPLHKELPPESLALLHKVAFDQKDYLLVIDIGGTCYQTTPSKDIALRNARACGLLKQPRPAVGWLETAFQEGAEDLQSILKENAFDPIRNEDLFRQFEKIHL